MTAPKDTLRREMAETLVFARFGESALMLRDPPPDATDRQRIATVGWSDIALEVVDALLSGPLAPILAEHEADKSCIAADQVEIERLTREREPNCGSSDTFTF